MNSHQLKDLVGQTIRSIFISDSNTGWSDNLLSIVTDEGTWVLNAHGDCCSESWFDKHHLEGVENVVNYVVTAVRDREESHTNNEDNRSRQVYDVIYATEIDTQAGTCVFEMRNSSNGYYGGSWIAEFEPR